MAVLLRFVLSAVALLISYRLFKIKVEIPRTRQQWGAIAIVGVILGALYPLQVSGLVSISTGLSAAIMLLAPVILVVLAPFITDEQIEPQKILAIALGVVGGLILLSKNLANSPDLGIGIWLTLGAAACLAFFTVINRKFSTAVDHPTMTFWSFVVGAIVVSPLAIPEFVSRGPIPTENLLRSTLALVYLAAVCTALPFFIWNKATSMTETKNLASTMHAKTPVAILLGAVIFQEALTWQLIAGTLMVTFALWLSQSKNIFAKKIFDTKFNNDEHNQFSGVQVINSNGPYFNFQPDLIAEVTNACNRACSGCYAANILINKNTTSPLAQFLSPSTLNLSMRKLDHISMTAIRGGEPSVHPKIGEVLEVASKNSETVVLETHGRWIEPNSPLLEVCRKNNVVIKISFDSMHGLPASSLSIAHKILDENSIRYLVAITERSYEDFLATRALCHWVTDGQIIFQKKAAHLDELIKPNIGVIKVTGELAPTLSVKNAFLGWRANA